MKDKEKPLHIRLRLILFFLLLSVVSYAYTAPRYSENNLRTDFQSYCADIRAYADSRIDDCYNAYLEDEAETADSLKEEILKTFLWEGFTSWTFHSGNRLIRTPVSYTATVEWNDEWHTAREREDPERTSGFPDYIVHELTEINIRNSPIAEQYAGWGVNLYGGGKLDETDTGYRFTEDHTRYLTDKDGTTVTCTVHYAIGMKTAPVKWGFFLASLVALLPSLLIHALFCCLLYNLTVCPLMEVAIGLRDGMPQLKPPQKHQSKVAERIRGFYRYSASRQQSDKTEITRLKTALDYASKAEENRRLMTSAIAHELKTPLAVIHSHAEALQSDISADKREHYLQVLLTETERIDGIVMELLDLSRLEAGKIHLSQDEMDFRSLVAEAADKFRPLAEARGLRLTCEQEGSEAIHADEGRLRQVVDNFLSNAIRYCLPDGEIRVHTKIYGSGLHSLVQFSVENSAEALSQEDLERIWDTFYKTDKSRSEKGTGLGLAIAKSIIALHGGTCRAENTKLGVRFSFEIKNV